MTGVQKRTIFEAVGRGPVHPFPARMAPNVALEILGHVDHPLRVLDPMMGSGTVLALARAKGHRAVGVDIDPLSILISKVWTKSVDVDDVREKAVDVLERARDLFSELHVRDAYPRGADEETRNFVRYWFDGYARRQLAALAATIDRTCDGGVRDVLWCAFSRLIIVKQAGASLAMDLSHSRPHRTFSRAPQKPFRNFLLAVDRVLDNCLDSRKSGLGPAPRLLEGDARHLPLPDATVDLVLTSPPYLNAIDYMRCSKFSLVWMGYRIPELRTLRSRSIGSEVGRSATENDEVIRDIKQQLRLRPQLSRADEAVLDRYMDDMRRALGEAFRVLSPKGKAVYVVGENTTRGTYIRNSVILSALGQSAGFRLKERRARVLPDNRRYLPPPARLRGSGRLDNRIRREVILVFKKKAA